MSPNMYGALLMIASMAFFNFNDALIKLAGDELPLWQILFLRGILASVLILVLGVWFRALDFRMGRRDWVLVSFRCATEIGAAYFFISALFQMPLANVVAILQVLPLTVSLGAALFFGEALGWRRMTAIVVGFGGMLLIVRPGAEGFTVWSLYALAAVLCVTARDLITREISAGVSSMTVTLIASISVMIFAGFGTAVDGWVDTSARAWLLIAGASVMIFGAYYFSVQVMRQGEITFIAPFRYTSLVVALILGWLVFDDWPDAITMLGAMIIVATGLFTLFRERALSRA